MPARGRVRTGLQQHRLPIVKVDKKHCIDKSDPDETGHYDYYYDYYLYEFSDNGIKLVARRYSDEQDAHLLRIEKDNCRSFVTNGHLSHPLVAEAIDYLMNEGISGISYLGENAEYIKIK